MTKWLIWVVLLVCLITVPTQLVRSVQECQTVNKGHLQGNIRADGLRRVLRYDARHETSVARRKADLAAASAIHNLNPSSCLL